MTFEQAIFGFAVVAAAITLLPGLDMMLVLRESLEGSRARGIAAAFGVAAGILVWAVAAAVGIAAVVNGIPAIYDALRIAGGGYLLYLAWSSARSGRRSGTGAPEGEGSSADMPTGASADGPALPAGPAPASPSVSGGLGAAFARGFLTDVLNPKIGVFYLAVIPQFLVPEVGNLQMGFCLGLVHVVESIVVLSAVACAAAFFARRLKTPQARRVTSMISAAVMVLMGGATLFEVARERISAA